MNTRQLSFAMLAVLFIAPAGTLMAQRRTTSGGGSTGRSAPSAGGGSRSSGGDRRSTGSPSGSRSSGGSSGTATRGGDSGNNGGSSARPSTSSSANSGSSASSSSSSGRPTSGKIGAVKASAREVRSRTRSGGGVIYGGGVYLGTCFNCGYWGYYGPRWGWYDGGWWYPARHPRYYGSRDDEADDGLSQGYMPYPYAESDGTGETFLRRRTDDRHAFGALTVGYFNDAGSGTQAGQVALEGALRQFHADLEYRHYAEPVVGRTDHLQTLRFSVGVQPALGKRAYLIAGVGARGVWLDDGSSAGGPEGTLGIQLFPMRPLGVNVTGHLAGLSWNGQDYFTLRELNTTGSIFLGRVELQAGWHFLKLGGSPAFGGPVVGTRIWF